MCRYAFKQYKPRLACFGCRKAFRRRLKADVDPSGEEQIAKCPQCAQPMADLGLDFRPPPQTARKAWSAIASLWRIGITFHSCGCGGPGWRPSTPTALRAYLEQVRASAIYQRDRWQSTPVTGAKLRANRASAMASFSREIRAIEAELAALR
jgi:hypothetical protein